MFNETRMKWEFIYQPRSGDRVFAFRETSSIVVVRWDDGCRTVFGGHHLELRAAMPERWCRDDARRLFSEMVGYSGGVAWDDQGDVHVIAPRLALLKVARVLPSLLPAIPREEVMAALWRAKIARWQDGEFFLQEPSWKEEQAGDVDPPLLVQEEPDNDEGRPSRTRWRIRDAREGYGSFVIERPRKDDGMDDTPIWWRGRVMGRPEEGGDAVSRGCGYCGHEWAGDSAGWYCPSCGSC